MAITPIPSFSGTPPNRNQPQATFNTNVANWVTYTTTIQTDLNAFGTEANALAVEVDGYKSLALTYRNEAAASASAALTSQNLAAASADFKGAWLSLSGALSKPASVFHNGSFWALLNNLANVSTSEPSLTNTDWQFISGTRWQEVQTSAFTAAKNTLFPVTATSATLDVTLPAFAAGDFFVISNNPQSTQLIRIVKPGVTVRNFRNTVVASGDNITYRAGQTFRAYAISSTELVAY